MQTFFSTLVRLSQRWGKPSLRRTPERKAPQLQELEPGTLWGQFRIIRKLGKGSFGTVYQARDPFEREVALKLLTSPEAISEGKVLSQLRHPNIVSVFSYENTPAGCGLSMEFINGQSLEQFATSHGPVDATYAALTGTSLCRALSMVHRKGLIHRDIKPSNVMRQADGSVVLVDFGLGQNTVDLDRATDIVGTLPYMAPELFEGSSASTSTDIYAVGVLLFHLVSLDYPVTGGTFETLQEGHRSRKRQHLIDLRPDLPPEFIRVVETAIAPEPMRRFRTAGAMAHALEAVLQVRPTRPRWVLTTSVATVASIAVFLTILLRPGLKESPTDTQFTRATKADALSQDPTLSGDGSLLAYASDEAEPGNLDIWVRQAPDGAAIRLTNHPAIDWMPAFSSDGHLIAFRSERDGGGIYTIPALGGKERLIATAGYAPRFSPDGRYIAYYTGELWHPRIPSAKIFVVPAVGGSPQQICPQMADARNPVWAPDSRHILFQGSENASVPPDNDADWWIADMYGSAPEKIGALRIFEDQGLEVHTWSAFWKDDRLIFSAAKNDNVNLWSAHISSKPPFRLGEVKRLTYGAGYETSPWMAENGRLAFATSGGLLHIWSLPFDKRLARSLARAEQITNTADLDAFPTISRDERLLAFTRTSSETGIRQLWVKDLLTHEELQLTNDVDKKENPMISPDGNRVAFSVVQREADDIYVLDRKSRAIRQVCSACGIVTGWSSDGASVLISAKGAIERLEVESGKRRPLLFKSGLHLDEAEWSPDGRWIAFSAMSGVRGRHVYLASEKNPSQWIQTLESLKSSEKPHWSADGLSLYFYTTEDGFPCIWRSDFDKTNGVLVGPIRAVQHFHNVRQSPIHISQPVRGFAVTAHRVYYNLADVSGSVFVSVSRK